MPKLNKILIDTHIWIWLISGDTSIKQNVVKVLRETANNGMLYLASISLWEICMLETKGRLILDQPIQKWLTSAIEKSKINILDISPEITIESTNLPGSFHGDPADRIIVATARINNLVLTTRDNKIIEYSENKYIHTIAA